MTPPEDPTTFLGLDPAQPLDPVARTLLEWAMCLRPIVEEPAPARELYDVDALPRDLSTAAVAHNLADPEAGPFGLTTADLREKQPWYVIATAVVGLACFGVLMAATVFLPSLILLLPVLAAVIAAACLYAHYLELLPGVMSRPLPPTPDLVTKLAASTWEGVDRNGDTVRERDHIYLGRIPGTEFPFLLHEDLLRKNGHVQGPTGSGKDLAGMGTIIPQAIERGYHVLYIACKRDDLMIQYTAHVARCAGVPYKLGTIDPAKASYALNPHLMTHWLKLTPAVRAQLGVVTIGVNETTMTSGNYFPTKNEEFYKPLWVHHHPQNFAQALATLKDHAYSRKHGFTDRDRDHASYLTATLARIADVLPLNAVPGLVDPAVLLHQIDIGRDILSAPGITYLDLPADIQETVARAASKMFVHHTMAAAGVHDGPRVPVLVVISDAPSMMDSSMETVLRHCRSFGISMWLVHQAMGDLKIGKDFAHSVTTNTHVKIYFPGGDPAATEYLEKASGLRFRRAGDYTGYLPLDPRHPEPQWLAPRIDGESVLTYSHQRGVAFVDARPATGLTRFRFPVPVRFELPLPPAMYETFKTLPWPVGGPGTVTAIDHTPPAAPPAPKERPRPLGGLFGRLNAGG